MSGDPGYFMKSSNDPLFENKIDQCLLGDILRFRSISVQISKKRIHVRITGNTTPENSLEMTSVIFQEAISCFKEICENSSKFRLAMAKKKVTYLLFDDFGQFKACMEDGTISYDYGKYISMYSQSEDY